KIYTTPTRTTEEIFNSIKTKKVNTLEHAADSFILQNNTKRI
ncbi:14464_t:CDS:1, partial [Dentiscutata heterogama]